MDKKYSELYAPQRLGGDSFCPKSPAAESDTILPSGALGAERFSASSVLADCLSVSLKRREIIDTIANMKTIAITIDDATLKLLDELRDASSRRSRSALVRTALREFAERECRRQVEAKDSAVFRKHRKRLARQALALISEQARP